MQTLTVYRYMRADGGISISPDKPDGEYTELTRVIAEDGKLLKLASGDYVGSIDTANASGITEVDEVAINSYVETLETRQDENDAALMELASLVDSLSTRADEHEGALVELAGLAGEEE